ncbi:MAG: response regulator [Verrucomicrobia bacterium]|nr:response regulator [Verrucomicrobiota bacterium]
MKTILLVDDEPTLRETLADALRDGLSDHVQCKVVVADSGIRAIELLARQPFDLVVTDLCMPQVDGFKLLDHLGRHHPRLPVVAMTGYGFPEVDQFVQNLGARLFLEKPFELRTLFDAVAQLLAADEESSIQGFSLPSFLQMMELDKKSSLVHVRAGDAGQQSGQLGFVRGQLVHASATGGGHSREHWHGALAVTEMLGWRDLQLRVSHLSQTPPERNVFTPLSTLLMASAHAFDERMAARQQRAAAALIEG